MKNGNRMTETDEELISEKRSNNLHCYGEEKKMHNNEKKNQSVKNPGL